MGDRDKDVGLQGIPTSLPGRAQIRLITADLRAQAPTAETARDADARLVARLIALLDEAMDSAARRGGARGQALIDTLAIDIFRVIAAESGAAASGPAETRRAFDSCATPPSGEFWR